MIRLPEKHRVLVVDDEPDVHAVSKLSLRGLRLGSRSVELASASSGAQAVEAMRSNPGTAVILLDVVMESEHAGLDACRAIRGELGNRLVRILLRTGQPGAAPERETIDGYDIDGYLAKAELTSTRLYAAVRTALKAFEELVELERYRQVLSFIHQSSLSLPSFQRLEISLETLLATAIGIAPAPLAVLELQTFEEQGNPRRFLVHLSTDLDAEAGKAGALAIAAQVTASASHESLKRGGDFGDGFLVPLVLHRELGRGYIYLQAKVTDSLALTALPLLAAHAGNALYSAVAQALLAAREGPFFDSVTV